MPCGGWRGKGKKGGKNKTGADGKCQLFLLKQSCSIGKPSQRNLKGPGQEKTELVSISKRFLILSYNLPHCYFKKLILIEN